MAGQIAARPASQMERCLRAEWCAVPAYRCGTFEVRATGTAAAIVLPAPRRLGKRRFVEALSITIFWRCETAPAASGGGWVWSFDLSVVKTNRLRHYLSYARISGPELSRACGAGPDLRRRTVPPWQPAEVGHQGFTFCNDWARSALPTWTSPGTWPFPGATPAQACSHLL